MIVYLVRHGKQNGIIRTGFRRGDIPLNENGNKAGHKE